MRKSGYLLMLLLVLALAAPVTGWAAKDAGAAGEDKTPAAAAGKDEGEATAKGEAREEGQKEGTEAKEDECPATFGPIITDTAVPLEKGKFAVQPTFGLSFVTNSLTRNWRRISAGGDFKTFGMDWKFTYGLCNNLEVFLVVPFVNSWAGSVKDPGPNQERFANFGGLSDVNLTFKYRLVEEGPVQPTVTALFSTDFPTGHFKRLNPGLLGVDAMGCGAYVFTTGLNLSKYFKSFIFYGNLWYSMQTGFTGDDGRQYPRDFVTVNLAAEYIITKKWIALLEFTSFWDGGRLFGHKANLPPGALLSVLPGIEYMATDKLSFALGVNFDLIGKNGTANITPLFSFAYCF
jgi:hypothetical protein